MSVLSVGVAFLLLAVVVADEIGDAGGSGGGGPIAGFSEAFAESFMVILATEIGDKTFFIAAIMAMRHSRFITWAGAVGALIVMTVLSTVVGHVAPLLIPKVYTHYMAAVLFLIFGIRMLRDGYAVTHAGASDELEEVELELAKKQACLGRVRLCSVNSALALPI